MRKTSRIYFAYGCNLNNEIIHQRCIAPKVIGIARLPGYKLGFYGHSYIWDGAVEGIVKDPLSELWGVLYDLSFSDCDQLDGYEDARFDGAGVHFHYPVRVFDVQNTEVEAILYKKSELGEKKLPSTEYLHTIVQGARENGLPEEYVNTLQNMPSKPAAYPVPKPHGVAYHECSDCTDLRCDEDYRNDLK